MAEKKRKVAKKVTKKTTKKKAAKKAPAKKARGRKLSAKADPFPMKLSGKRFLEYKAAMAEMWNARNELRYRELQLTTLLERPEHAILLKHQTLVQDALKEASVTQTNFKQVQALVAERFGIPMADLVNYTINEYSGAMVFTPPKEDDQGSADVT